MNIYLYFHLTDNIIVDDSMYVQGRRRTGWNRFRTYCSVLQGLSCTAIQERVRILVLSVSSIQMQIVPSTVIEVRNGALDTHKRTHKHTRGIRICVCVFVCVHTHTRILIPLQLEHG